MSSKTLILAVVLFIQADPGQDELNGRIGRLLKRMNSDRIEDRDAATVELKRLDPAAISMLKVAIDGSEPEVQARIREIIAVLEVTQLLSPGLRKAHPELAEKLSKGPPHVWTEVFLAVSEQGRARPLEREDLDCLVVRALREAKAGSEQVRMCDALAASPLPSAAPILIDFLASDIETVSDAARIAMIATKSTKAGTRLEALLKDSRDWVRSNAALVLEALGTASQVPLLVPMVSDSSSRVRLAAGRALARLDREKAVKALTANLSHGESSYRRDAVISLSEIGAPPSTSSIVESLKDSDAQVRAAAVKALVRLDAKGAGADISKLLEDSDLHVRVCALQAVKALVLEEAYPRLVMLLRQGREGNETTLSLAAEGMAHLRGSRCSGDLADILKTGSGPGRLHAIRIIGHVDATDLVPDLVRVLKQDDVRVVSSAVLALGDLGERTGFEELRTLLSSPDPGLRAQTATVLGRLGDRDAMDQLRSLLGDKERSVRVHAALALAYLGCEDGVGTLLESSEADGEVSLMPLSAIRSPDAWKRARAMMVKRKDLRGGPEVIAKQLAQALGSSLVLELSKATPDEKGWLWEEIALGNGEGRKSVVELLRTVVEGSTMDCILEDGKVRLLRGDDALKEWKAWWSSRKGK